MKKSKVLLIITLLLFTVNSGFSEEKKEMIVLFDTSVSVLPYYDFLSGRLINDLVKEHLNEGDSFHMLSFDDEPHFEFSMAMKGTSEEDRIISYTSLLQPMGQHTDFISALNFLYRFTQDLPLNTSKKILILSDGIHDPPPSSPLYGKDQDYINNEISNITGKIYREGWDIHLLKLPVDGKDISSISTSLTTKGTEDEGIGISNAQKTSGDLIENSVQSDAGTVDNSTPTENDNSNYMNLLAEELNTPAVQLLEENSDVSNIIMGNVKLSLLQPADAVGYKFVIKGLLKNFGEQKTVAGIKEILWNGNNILTESIPISLKSGEESSIKIPVRIPENIEEGPLPLSLKFIYTEGSDITPSSFNMEIVLVKNESPYTGNIPLKLILGIVAIIVFVILVIIFIRKRIETPTTHKTIDHSVRSGSYSRQDSELNGVVNADNSETTEALSAFANNSINAKTDTALLLSGKSGQSDSDSTELSVKKSSNLMDARTDSVHSSTHVPQKKAKTPKGSSAQVKINEKEAHLALEMHVVGQNPYKWTRNINVLKAGDTLIIGNRHEPFSIFIIDFPKGSAEISFDGKKYTFTPLKHELFPELTAPMSDCLDQYIKVVSETGKQTSIIFRKWTPPLLQINRILHLIDEPGMPDFRY
ncbi:MAG: VWA domain-containing protein [Spirochaetales bacterium]|nr:VWA domain-containing protein [Spirochaetales bacterium]